MVSTPTRNAASTPAPGKPSATKPTAAKAPASRPPAGLQPAGRKVRGWYDGFWAALEGSGKSRNGSTYYLILGSTLALPLAIAGFAGTGDWVYFLGVPPALVLPGIGFKLAYQKACTDVRRTMDSLLDAAEEGPYGESDLEDQPERPPGHVRGLKPIPKYTRPSDE